MAILTTTGRAALVAAVAEQPLHLAVGRGLAAWDDTPEAEPISKTALTDEIARRAPSQVAFCVSDQEGDIILPEGRYSVSLEPTPYLYVRTQFDYGELVGEPVREVGLFVGTELVGGLPEGQMFFPPADVATGGLLMTLTHYDAAKILSADERLLLEIVFTL